MRYEGINGSCTSIKVGHNHSVGPWEEVIEVLGSSAIRPGIGVWSGTKGRGKINASVICSKARYVGIGKGQGKGIGRLGDVYGMGIGTSGGIGNGNGICSCGHTA